MPLVCPSCLPATPGLPTDRSRDVSIPETLGLSEALPTDMPVVVSPSSTAFGVAAVFERTPVEVFVEVFKHLDLNAAFRLARTNKRFASIFSRHKTSIILPIVANEFGPFRGLLQVVTMDEKDLATPWDTWLDKRIRRNNMVLCEGGLLPLDLPPDLVRPFPLEYVLGDADMERILAVCKVVRGWERIFPQHRFDARPTSTRSLLPHENYRLRSSLYTWMRYSFYFHGDLPRPNTFFPAGRDIRINQLRVLSNSELRELGDLWSTVQDIIRLKLCPSIALVRSNAVGGTTTNPGEGVANHGQDFQLSYRDAARIGFGDWAENQAVVATFCKLQPADLLHYLDNLHRYPKASLIRDVRRRHPRFELDTESLSSAVASIDLERGKDMATNSTTLNFFGRPIGLPPFANVSRSLGGGILDPDDAGRRTKSLGWGR